MGGVARIVMLGPPASGKGTQGSMLAAALGAPHVSSGHLLRRSMDRGDPYGVRPLVSRGQMVPDDIVEALLRPALGPRFVLDGYPRTARQAARLDALLAELRWPLDAAVELVLDEPTLAARIILRAGAEKRSDDRPDVFLRRLAEYRRHIPGLRAYYGPRLVPVDAAGSPQEVFRRLTAALALRSGINQPG
jgi:adenylate kinase